MFDGMTDTEICSSLEVEWECYFKRKNNKTTKKQTLKCEESVSFRFVTVNCVKENLNNNNKNFSDFVYIFYYIFAGIIP